MVKSNNSVFRITATTVNKFVQTETIYNINDLVNVIHRIIGDESYIDGVENINIEISYEAWITDKIESLHTQIYYWEIEHDKAIASAENAKRKDKELKIRLSELEQILRELYKNDKDVKE